MGGHVYEKRSRVELHREAQQFAGVCLSVNSLMAAFKVGVGLFSSSHALLANALYSVNDVLTSIAVAVSLRVSRRRPNTEHPYGYTKAEFIAAAMVSLTIAIGVLFMFFFSVIDILRGVPGPPHLAAMSLAAVSMLVSWQLSARGHRLAAALRSPVLNTHAEHHHADAEGSLLAILGVGGAVLGFHTFDRMIAVTETVHLIWISGRLLARSVHGLMDTAMPEEDTLLVTDAVCSIEGVVGVGDLRSRQSGSETWVDLGLKVSPQLDVAQAYGLCQQAEEAVRGVLGPTAVAQVRFHGPSASWEPPGPGGSSHG